MNQRREYTLETYSKESRGPALQQQLKQILGDAHSIDGLLGEENILAGVADPIAMGAAKVAVLDRISVLEGRLLTLRKLVMGVLE
jgi:hypothetical protein